MIQSSPERAMICTVWMLGMVAIAPKVGRLSRHCWRRRLSGAGSSGHRKLRDQAGTRPPKNGVSAREQRVRPCSR